ncbi:MAG: DUF669 domain-containing protein [Clostridiales bacterium]|nr:DUF669 domain-containing protein [Clostridiales bacterium]
MADMEREFNWDDEITKDSEYTLLPAGDYRFTVESYERSRFNGSDNLPACNMAIVKIRINAGEAGETTISHRLYLHSKTEGILSAFFSSIGLKKKGEPLRMNWNQVPGSSGKCKLGIREYKEEKYNEIKRFYPSEENRSQYKAGDF